jgi:thiol:disulfide interchange protein DsbD
VVNDLNFEAFPSPLAQGRIEGNSQIIGIGQILLVVVCTWLVGASTGFSQGKGDRFDSVVRKLDAKFEPANAKPGDTVKWKLTLDIIPGWHIYAAQQLDPESSYVTGISFPKMEGLTPVGEIIEPTTGHTVANPESGQPLMVFDGVFSWEQSFKVTSAATNGTLRFPVKLKMQVCNDTNCLPQERREVVAELVIAGGSSAASPPTPPKSTTQPLDDDVPVDTSAYKATMAAILAQMEKQPAPAHSGLWSFILTAMFWGGISLLTPCVFPMIPITVSFFLKQSEKNNANPVVLAIVYCATIIVVLGGASLTLLSFFTALSINPIMNLFLGVLFVVLALSLFGMFDLTLPASLTRFTSSREGQGGLIGTVFMALTFTVVSFTCVAPFLGGFGGMASSGQFSKFELIVGALAFAATFAAPFFVLALFPSLIRKLPKSGGWLHTVKVVMAFIELAAALKFFRTAELIFLREPVLFTYDFVMGMWVVLSILCGLYLIRLIHIGTDEIEQRGVSVPQFLVGFAFISLGFYLLPAMFAGGPDGGNHRPRGAVFAWVDSFLLPDPSTNASSELQWTADLKRALDEARAEAQRTGRPAPVFIDFTGETCTNCKLNERNVFTRPEVRELFKKYKLVQLYTDKVPDDHYPAKIRSTFKGTARQRADADVNRWFEDQAFGSQQLPLYVLLEPKPDGSITVKKVYDEGKINNVGAFVEFLKSGIGGSAGIATAGFGQ